MSADASAEVLEKLAEWSEEEVRANIDNILPTLLRALSSDDVGLKFQVVQALLITCLPCVPVLEAEERLLQHAVPAAKQLLSDAIECLHSSLEEGILTQVDNIGDRLRSFLEVCTTILKCSGAVLECFATQGHIDVATISSVPENIALMLVKTFQHCKESQSLYGQLLDIVSEFISDLFRESYHVQVQFFNVMAENVQFKCYVEDELQLLIKVLEAVSDGGEILFCLDLKSMAEQWKGYTRLTNRYTTFLQSNLDLQKPLSVLVSEVERLLGEVIKAPSSDPKLMSKCLKVGSFLIKIILKLSEQFGGYLADSAHFLFNLVFTLYSHSSVTLSNTILPESVIEDLQRYIVVAADPLVGVLYTDYSFRHAFFSCCIKQAEPENGTVVQIPTVLILTVIKLILQCDPTERSLWISKDPTSNIFSAVFSVIKFGHNDFTSSRFIEMTPKDGTDPRRIDLYGALVAHAGALVVSATAEEIETIESTLLHNILQRNPWPALLASDLWVILARTASSKLCLDQILFLAETLISMIDAKIECPEKSHLCLLLRRLVPLLSSQDKGLLVEKYPLKSYPGLWLEIGFQTLPENIKAISIRDFASLTQDSIAKFLGNGQVIQLIKGLKTASATLKTDPKSISASSLSSIWNKIPPTESTLIPWLTSCETRDSVTCWLQDFLCALCEATSYLVTNMTNQQILEVLQRLRAVVPLTSSVLKLNMLKVLRSLALKLFNPDEDQSKVCSEIAALFADLLQDKNPIICLCTLDTFSYFAHLTKHENIFVNTVSGNQKLKQMVTNFIQKTLPSTECNSQDEVEIFAHKCIHKDDPDSLSSCVSPPPKKLKFDDEIDINLDAYDFLGSAAFFEEELHSAVIKLTESCADIVNYASANPIPEETVNKLRTVISDLQKVIVNEK